MTSKISLNAMRFYAYHGVLPQEKKVGNWFSVDLELSVDLSRAALSDQLQDTLNYAEVYAAASLVGAFVFCMLRFSLGVEIDSWLAFLLVLIIRFAAIRWNWSLYHPRPPRGDHDAEEK